jgi:hypothetical protein
MYLTVVAENPVQGLQGQIPSPASSFKKFEKKDTLDIVLEGRQTGLQAKCGQFLLAVMSKRRVAYIMAEGDGLDQILIQPQKPAYCPGNL